MMKYVTPLNVFLYFVVLGILGTAFVEYVFWTKHEFFDYATLLIFALFPFVGAIAALLTKRFKK